ncbi:MAG TPA: hypothetical protein VE997_02960 [Candidatus Limnocylindria bacterium]|jgi:hypothetical protein|nr:hypothetical protein [Candidatus Limnocylindria bacterium]
MKRSVTSTTLAAGALLAWMVLPASAADSVTGEVVDLACYLVHPQSSTGAGHKKCAEVCMKKGLPAGLLTADKQLYLLIEDHDNAKPYAAVREKAAQTVTVEGQKVTQNGMQGIVVEAVK